MTTIAAACFSGKVAIATDSRVTIGSQIEADNQIKMYRTGPGCFFAMAGNFMLANIVADMPLRARSARAFARELFAAIEEAGVEKEDGAFHLSGFYSEPGRLHLIGGDGSVVPVRDRFSSAGSGEMFAAGAMTLFQSQSSATMDVCIEALVRAGVEVGIANDSSSGGPVQVWEFDETGEPIGGFQADLDDHRNDPARTAWIARFQQIQDAMRGGICLGNNGQDSQTGRA